MKVWAEETLGDLCSLITDGKHGDCRNEDNSGYYFISCKDVREGRIHYENARQIVHGDFAETHRRTDLRPGDVLLTNSGTIGRLAIAPDDEKTQRTTFQKSVAILKPLPKTITSQFLYYSLAADRDRLINSAGGAAQKNLLLGELRRFPIRVPPLSEQAEIASILSVYDDLIENNRRRIQRLEESARLLYREWFVRFRFPGHEDVKIIDGVPEGWEKSTVSGLGKIVTGKTPSTKTPENFGGNIPFVKTPDMHRSRVIVETEEFLSERGANTQANKTLPVGSILVACIGARLGVVSITCKPCQTNQQINAVIPRHDHYRYYGLFALIDIKPRLEAMGGGATMPNVNKSKFASIPILIPSQILLQEFQEFASYTFQQIQLLHQQKVALAKSPRPPSPPPDERRNRSMSAYTEDTLVQQTTADYLRDELGWESVYAYNEETFGSEGTLGRKSDREVVLTRYLGEAFVKLNPGLPMPAYQEAIRRITEYSVTQSALQINMEKHELFRNGVLVDFRNENDKPIKRRLRVFDFDKPENNHFLAVRELWVRGALYRRRADIIGFVNGIPLLFMELKNIHKNIRTAYEKNLSDYKDTIPHLFHHNAVIVLANGVDAKIGSLSGNYEHFHEWKRLEEDEPGVVDMETLLKGICNKSNFLDLFENFIVFDDSSGELVKIIARNHQYLGVNRAMQAVEERRLRKGKLGVFWHTQGAGKSYSMVFFSQKVHRRLGGNFTFLIMTDRDDLDTQIYKTFAGCGIVDNDKDPCRAESGDDLEKLLKQRKAYIFTLIQKFNREVAPDNPYSSRDDIIVISDEAHRTQYGLLALNMWNALPNAGYIGFTGTPLFKDDEITRRVFGDYISTYDFKRAVDDKATVPLYYDARGDKLGVAKNDLNERIAEKLEELEIEDIDVAQRLEKELKRDYHIITSKKRLNQIASDFVEHYSTAWESGKAMFVCIDKITCVRMYELIDKYWAKKIQELEKGRIEAADEQELIYRRRQIKWMKETLMAVVVSEEQGEVDKFRKWGLDITPHRKLIKEGFETNDGKRIDVDEAFKKENHPFRIVIVCAMWLTGFDVPSLSTMYLDKPLKAHTLMQAIARANRVYEGKNNGLVVDYCGILKNLRKALATFAGHQGTGVINGEKPQPEVDPVKPEEELLGDLAEAIDMIVAFLDLRNFRLDEITEKTGFDRNKAIIDAKEAVNENDETRKRFEIMAREVFKKFKACLTISGINEYRKQYDAINIIYKSLQKDRDKADIADIIRDLHEVVDKAIRTYNTDTTTEDFTPYDISKIDFDRLRKEFERTPAKNTTVQNLKHAIEQRLHRMIQQNPLRTDFQKHFEQIVEEYNREKDRVTIENTFEELLKFVDSLDEESRRAMQEGLDEESLAIFDLLVKPDLSSRDIKQIKEVAQKLLLKLKSEKLRIDNWREKQATRDDVKVEIANFLWNERTGLPKSYSEEEIGSTANVVYLHVFQQYPNEQPAVYAEAF